MPANAHLSLIVAVARNGVIGANGGIPWHLPDDLRTFKQLTLGHPIIMGRKTFESIGRLLPGRTTIVVTRQRGLEIPGAIVVHSLADALAAAGDEPEIFVIGGAELFREALPLATRLHLTEVEAEPAGDTRLPPFDRAGWVPTATSRHEADARHAYAYTYTHFRRR